MSGRPFSAVLAERRLALVMEATRLNAEHLRLTMAAQGAEIDPGDDGTDASDALAAAETSLADVESRLAALDAEIAEARRAEDDEGEQA